VAIVAARLVLLVGSDGGGWVDAPAPDDDRPARPTSADVRAEPFEALELDLAGLWSPSAK